MFYKKIDFLIKYFSLYRVYIYITVIAIKDGSFF